MKLRSLAIVRSFLSYAVLLLSAMLVAGLFMAAPINRAEAAFDRSLEVGMSGTDVSALQTYLASDPALYPEGLVTGYFGALTEKAVKRFQARYGIEQVGRVGPITRAKLLELDISSVGGGFGTGGSDDFSAPVMSPESVSSITGSSAAISWTTSEPSWSRAMYGTTWPFVYANAPEVKDTSFDTSTNVTLTGLAPNTLYYYVRESVDVAGNVMWTMAKSFRTLAAGASSGAPVSAATCTLAASPPSISTTSPVTLSWTTQRANGFSIDRGIGPVTPIPTGTFTLAPTATTTYMGTATGEGGSGQCAVTVNFTGAATSTPYP